MSKLSAGFYEDLNTKLYPVIYTPQGLFYYKGYIKDQLETVLAFCPDDPYDIVRLRIEEMLEELQ